MIKTYIMNDLLIGESKFSNENNGTYALYLRINSKKWETLLYENPYASAINRKSMLFFNSKVILDDTIDTWEFCHEIVL